MLGIPTINIIVLLLCPPPHTHLMKVIRASDNKERNQRVLKLIFCHRPSLWTIYSFCFWDWRWLIRRACICWEKMCGNGMKQFRKGFQTVYCYLFAHYLEDERIFPCMYNPHSPVACSVKHKEIFSWYELIRASQQVESISVGQWFSTLRWNRHEPGLLQHDLQ